MANDNERAIPTLPGPRRSSEQPKPTVPPQRTALHIPTAPARPASLTREQLDREIAAARIHEPYLVGYGGIQANAF